MNRDKAGVGLMVAAVLAALFLHANAGDSGKDTDVCKAQTGESLTQIVTGTFDKDDPYQRCRDEREGQRLLNK